MVKKITSVIAMLVGILCIISAVTLYNKASVTNSFEAESINYGEELSVKAEYEPDKSYGGDAYTGIQQAAAQAANNILALNENIEEVKNGLNVINENLDTVIEANSDGIEIIATFCMTVLFCGGILIECVAVNSFFGGPAKEKKEKKEEGLCEV